MKKSQLKEIIKEVLLENQPERAPERQTPDREVIEKPDTAPEKPTRRRTLTPPIESPDTKPKAIKENDKGIADKIASRFKKLGGTLNENTSRDKAISLILSKTGEYTKEDLESRSDKELGRIIFGFIGKK